MNTEEIIEGYLGDTEVNSIYQGSELVWTKYVGNRYLIGGEFNTYSPNVNVLDSYKNSIPIRETYNGGGSYNQNYEGPPFNGLNNNIVVTLDNSEQIDPEFAVTKINRRKSNDVNQEDHLNFLRYNIEPGKTMEMSFWYSGNYGEAISIQGTYASIYVERWNASTNAYITNNSNGCVIPVNRYNSWQYIKVRATNIDTEYNITRWGFGSVILHDDERKATFGNYYNWKITCLKLWHVVESVTKNKIIRLNDNDSIDNTWYNDNSYTSGTIYQLTYDNINKKIYNAGSPTLDGGLVRYNLDGSKDNAFNIGVGFNDVVRNIIIDNTNSKIYVAGLFTTFQGNTQNRIVRLNTDGSLDNTFNVGTGFNDDVRDIIIDNVNSKIYVGGSFTTYNDQSQKYIARLNTDGSLDNTFNVGTGFNDIVRSVIIDNSKIYVAGLFTTFQGNAQNRIVRLNTDGSLDDTFNVGSGFNNGAYALNIDTINQKIYVGGNFTSYNGTVQNRICRLDMDGSLDHTFNIKTHNNIIMSIGAGLDGAIESRSGILIDNEKNKIYIAGNFNKYNNISQKYIARLNYDGSLDNNFDIQLGSPAQTILKYTE